MLRRMFDGRPKIKIFGEVRFVSALPIRNTLVHFSKSSKKFENPEKINPESIGKRRSQTADLPILIFLFFLRFLINFEVTMIKKCKKCDAERERRFDAKRTTRKMLKKGIRDSGPPTTLHFWGHSGVIFGYFGYFF